MPDDSTVNASTTRSVASEAQTKDHSVTGPQHYSSTHHEGEEWDGYGIRYTVREEVSRAPPMPVRHRRGDPLYRPLRIYAMDPSASKLEGAIACINVPYEPLEPGPCGRLFRVDNYDAVQAQRYRAVDLDDHAILLSDGRDPSPSDPRFHQQMLYAVCSNVYATFRVALGRHIAWGFSRADDPDRLYLRPHAFEEPNAYYDDAAGALCFGYYQAEARVTATRTLPGGYVFTCLSHAVIAHELTHALLEGLRTNFSVASGPDVAAFHEAFADLVALFQRFSYKEVVRAAISRSRGSIRNSEFLTDLARQVGATTGHEGALRSAIGKERAYDRSLEAHELGSVLVAAVFDAFTTVYERKTARYVRLATAGSGVLPAGELPSDLQGILADRASRLASQFLSIIIRAIDYCPPCDLTFGEFLRAMITADYELVPDDVWAYREALIDACLKRKIYPRHVASLSEDSLLWRPPTRELGAVVALDFAHLSFRGDPACAAGPDELQRQARVLGEFVTRPEHLAEFGLVSGNDPRLRDVKVETPRVQSIRSARRVGPDGQVVFDLVGEVIQRCDVPTEHGLRRYPVYGGSTVIIGPEGEIRYSISKSVAGVGRMQRRLEFLTSESGRQYWACTENRYRQKGELFRMLHGTP
ncbi:MAG TPA: hypothetical protein VNT02_00445 [Burkholderiales bacterium]|nr:hypothetical protein [Burkholderiales bacterium]